MNTKEMLRISNLPVKNEITDFTRESLLKTRNDLAILIVAAGVDEIAAINPVACGRIIRESAKACIKNVEQIELTHLDVDQDKLAYANELIDLEIVRSRIRRESALKAAETRRKNNASRELVVISATPTIEQTSAKPQTPNTMEDFWLKVEKNRDTTTVGYGGGVILISDDNLPPTPGDESSLRKVWNYFEGADVIGGFFRGIRFVAELPKLIKEKNKEENRYGRRIVG
jgi:hypothetical protein